MVVYSGIMVHGCMGYKSWSLLTFTRLSHPQETMTGAVGEGEKRTHDTHSE